MVPKIRTQFFDSDGTRHRTTKNPKAPFNWTEEANQALVEMKRLLTIAPILAPPNFEEKFVVHADASDTGVGAVLAQNIKGDEKVVAFFSAKLNGAQRNYTTTEDKKHH